MSEMDAPPKMEQFWEDPPMNHHHSSSHGHSHNNNNNSSSNTSGNSSSTSGNAHQQQYERNLNFATGAVEENEYGFPKKKTIRDPLSHRIIEKRRRDRMNNCLADLARLLPPSSLRKGRGRIEKTEIVELAIKHLRHLQCHPCPSGEKCEFNYIAKSSNKNKNTSALQNHTSLGRVSSPSTSSLSHSTPESHFRLGFQECMSEAMHFLVEEEGLYPGDGLCVRILKHLTTHSENVLRDHFGKDGKLRPKEENRGKSCKENDATSDFNNQGGSGDSNLSGYQPQGSSSGSDGNTVQDGDSFALPVPNPSTNSATTERVGPTAFDFEGDNSCGSTQLSLDISDVFSVSESKNRSGSKPPIPTIICSNNSMQSSHAMHSSSNGRSSDEGQDNQDGGGSSSSNSLHRYKFKNTIKQRFTADLEKPEDGDCPPSRIKGHATKGSLKQGNSELTDIAKLEIVGNSSDIEEEDDTASMKILPMDLDDDCMSTKSYRGSTISNSTGRIVPYSDNRDNDSMKSTKSDRSMAITPFKTDVKLSREELLKAFAITTKPTLPLPIILDEGDRKSVGVPAFALHDKGLYYIPLTIDKSVLSPYLAKLEPHTPPPLHPVTISVCFLLAPPLGKIPREDSGCTTTKVVEAVINPVDLKTIPIPHPIAVTHTASSVTPVVLKPPRSSREAAANFVINRYNNSQSQQSQSRQYASNNNNNNTYRYPMSVSYGSTTTTAPTANTVPVSGAVQKEHRSTSHQYHPTYYSSSEGGHVSNSGMFPLPPLHVPGYGSSSSSSSSSSSNNNLVRCSRKRSICSSPMSGSSSSIGYHSLHEKYSPSHSNATQDYYNNTPYSSSNNTHSNNSNVGQGHHGTHHHHHHVNTNHNYINSNYLVPMQNEKSRGTNNNNNNPDVNVDPMRRSGSGGHNGSGSAGSPSKRAKKPRDNTTVGDEVLKPLPVPQSIIPVASLHQ